MLIITLIFAGAIILGGLIGMVRVEAIQTDVVLIIRAASAFFLIVLGAAGLAIAWAVWLIVFVIGQVLG